MINQHPLTDELCENIATNPQSLFDEGGDTGEVVFTHDDMRAAYDVAIVHVYEIWAELCEYEERDSTISWKFSRKLNKMYPQQQQENN